MEFREGHLFTFKVDQVDCRTIVLKLGQLSDTEHMIFHGFNWSKICTEFMSVISRLLRYAEYITKK